MLKWEYRIFNEVLTEEELDHLGEQGWELSGVVYAPEEATPYFYFKRPKP